MKTFFTQNNRTLFDNTVFGVIKYVYAVSNRSMFAILTGTFPLTTLSKHSQISVMVSRFEVFLINRLSWSGISYTICRRIDKFFFFNCDWSSFCFR